MAQLLLLGHNIAACVLIARSCGGPQETRPARILSGKEASMDTRRTLLALLALVGLGVSTTFGQNWTADPSYGSYGPPAANKTPVLDNGVPSYPSPGSVTATTVTTCAPCCLGTGYSAGWVPPSCTQTSCAAPRCVRPVCVARPVVAPCPTVVYRPVAPTCASTCVAYRPNVVSTFRAPAYLTRVAGPRVYVHPKVYVEGQPIRNLLRAITP